MIYESFLLTSFREKDWAKKNTKLPITQIQIENGTRILTILVGAHTRNIPKFFEANPCSNLRASNM